MDERRFGVFEFLGDVARQSEVRVLIDGAWNEAADVAHFAKDLGEGVGERGCSLDGAEVYLANVVSDEEIQLSLPQVLRDPNSRIGETKCGLCLVVGYLTGDLDDVVVKRPADKL